MRISLLARTTALLCTALLATGLQAAEPLTESRHRGGAQRGPSPNTRPCRKGANADYIPALAKVDPNIFGIALVTPDGQVFTAGDVTSEVSIQSISKVFTAALVMEEQGPEAIEDNMGVDATGQVFNSIVAIEQYKGARDEPAGQRRRHRLHQHGLGQVAGGNLEQDSQLLQ